MKQIAVLATILALASCGGSEEGSGSSDPIAGSSDPIVGIGMPGSVSTVPTN